MAEIDYFNPTIEVERNTILVGKFKGKYIGDKLDFIDSTNSFEKLFKLEVLSGEFIIDDFSNSHIKWSDDANKIYTGDYSDSGIIFPRKPLLEQGRKEELEITFVMNTITATEPPTGGKIVIIYQKSQYGFLILLQQF